jgi:SET domain-containing protein
MPYRQSPLIEVKQAGKKGLGVFASTDIRRGAVLESVPLVVMREQEIFTAAPRTTLADYVFSAGPGKVAFACGYGALYNHSFLPNARCYRRGSRSQVYVAIRAIRSGEEITVNYNGNPEGRSKVGFKVG